MLTSAPCSGWPLVLSVMVPLTSDFCGSVAARAVGGAQSSKRETAGCEGRQTADARVRGNGETWMDSKVFEAATGGGARECGSAGGRRIVVCAHHAGPLLGVSGMREGSVVGVSLCSGQRAGVRRCGVGRAAPWACLGGARRWTARERLSTGRSPSCPVAAEAGRRHRGSRRRRGRGTGGAVVGIVRIGELGPELFDVRWRARTLDRIHERPEPDDRELGRGDQYG